MNINISLVTPAQEREEFLARKASLLIHELKRGKKSRYDINEEIHKLDESEQAKFRMLLNKYREVK